MFKLLLFVTMAYRFSCRVEGALQICFFYIPNEVSEPYGHQYRKSGHRLTI
jgi:hypothetical protein